MSEPEPLSDFVPPPEVEDYVIGRELGRGASGCVYEAEDILLKRRVAIKFVAPRALDLRARQQFLLEARAVARIAHPNVVAIYRIAELGDRPFLVHELVRGVSLAQVPRPAAEPVAIGIAIDLARGLAAAHRASVVHCDVKPANVMIADDQTAKLVDFGVARVVGDAGSAGRDAPAGTPDYLAPEVWAGGAPTRRSDVYSLGAVIFELLAGAPPFADVPPAALRDRVGAEEAPPVTARAPSTDPRLAAVVARCLRRDPLARFANADEVRAALEAVRARQLARPPPDENPYRGLRAFEAAHRNTFFGRSAEVAAVLDRLRGEPLVIVAGDSGVGKSSLCRAGVIPAVLEGALGPGEWTAITVVPGRHPLRALAAALDEPALAEQLREAPELLARTLKRRAGARSLLVFLDQLEELMAVGEPDEVAVLDAALAPALEGLPGVCVLATVRADFLARLAELPRLGRDLSQQLYFLRPLPPERLRDVIVGPADAAGIAFESFAIVDELVASAARARDGGLPLLSFALADLWEARDLARGVITSAAVAAVGGVAGALARHADHLIASLSAAQRGHARAILTRLVSAAGTRVRRTAAELGVDGEGSAALDALVSGRLVVAHEPATEAARVASFELAHEVLISGWATLREWLATDAESSALRERLSAATAEWVRLGRRDEDTWQGVRLAEARALPGSLISADERAFLAASRRAAQQRRLVRWGSIGGAIALVALAIAVPRHLASRALARKIASEITAGEAELAAASAQVAARDRHAAAAFAEFDAGRRDDGEDTWELAQAADDAAAHAYLRASGRFETALRLDPQAAVTRSRLGDLLLSRMVHAEVRGDRRLVTELASRLELYDADGSRRARWALPGQVIVRARGALITIEGPEAPAAAAPARRVDPGPITLALKPGSYVLIARVPGRAPVRAPVLVERARTLTQVIDPPPAAGVPRGFVYVPAGEFLYGAESEAVRPFLETVPIHRRSTGEYLIGQTEVTFAEWLEFVDALPPAARAARIPRVESGIGGALAITAGSGGWRLQVRFQRDLLEADWGQPLVIAARARLREQRWQRLPVIGISAEDAVAYARWLASSGRVPGARLCTEEEWERAARGADGRPYPAGERLRAEDAAIDRTHGPQAMGLDEVGSHPRSRSPLGLDDMSGNVWELVRSGPAEFVIRGGAFRHDHRTAHLANRAAMNPAVRDLSVGLRICADLPKRDAR